MSLPFPVGERGWPLFGCNSAYGGTPPEAVAASLVVCISNDMLAPRFLPRIMCGVGSASVSIIYAKLSKTNSSRSDG
ncbi:MAG: hypothetical protein HY746_04485 [Elusimicrobia bacterium]|nr:hypothetical protein [Elusimicrobiota bacterium]